MTINIVRQRVDNYYSVFIEEDKKLIEGTIKKVYYIQDEEEEIYVTNVYINGKEVELTDELEDKIYQAFTHTNYEYVSMSREARLERRERYKGTIYCDADDDELAEKENEEIRETYLRI